MLLGANKCKKISIKQKLWFETRGSRCLGRALSMPLCGCFLSRLPQVFLVGWFVFQVRFLIGTSSWPGAQGNSPASASPRAWTAAASPHLAGALPRWLLRMCPCVPLRPLCPPVTDVSGADCNGFSFDHFASRCPLASCPPGHSAVAAPTLRLQAPSVSATFRTPVSAARS